MRDMRARLLEQFQSLRIELWKKVSRPSEVGFWPWDVRDETVCNGITDDCHHDGNCGCCLLGYERGRGSVDNENIDIGGNKFCCEEWQPLIGPFRPPKLHSYVCALNVTELAKPGSE